MTTGKFYVSISLVHIVACNNFYRKQFCLEPPEFLNVVNLIELCYQHQLLNNQFSCVLVKHQETVLL